LEQELISCSFAGSPVQLSSVPSTAKERWHDSKFVQMLLLFFLLYHQNYLHNLQNSTSGCFPWANISAIVGTIKFSDISYFFIQLAH
jgi:hypothetical protein